ncbi:MAG: response regulator [Spirochaetia bacterium]|nr:response regulator [Spirochaetia bacterium]
MARIIVVDDSKFMRTLVRDALVAVGHEIVGEAENGFEAIVLYQTMKPDLITMDITMPERGGLQATSEILKSDKSARILMVTALGQEPIVSAAIKLGVKGFVIKPFQPGRLQDAVARALA